MDSFVLIAAGQQDPLVMLGGLVLTLIAVGVLLIRQATMQVNVVTKGGVRYCPMCKRQVSQKRDVCRTCGYRYITYGPSQEEMQRALDLERAEIDRQKAAIAEWDKREEEERVARQERKEAKEQARIERRQAWLDRCRDKGVDPGPFAWFWLLSDGYQVVVACGVLVPVVGWIAFQCLSRIAA